MTKGINMHIPSLIAGYAALLFLAWFSPVSFAAEAGAGAIQQLTGDVTVTGANNVTRRAVAKENIQSGDTVTTEVRSEILIRMADGSTVALRPNTQFRFTDEPLAKVATTSKPASVRSSQRYCYPVVTMTENAP